GCFANAHCAVVVRSQLLLFFFSSRRRHTRFSRDWSSDVYSSDLHPELVVITDVCLCEYTTHGHCGFVRDGQVDNDISIELIAKRSEERRVGKEGSSRWATCQAIKRGQALANRGRRCGVGERDMRS